MDTNYKKVLIIHYDLDFAESVLELLKKSEIGVVLAANLSEGEDIIKKETFSLVVIEWPVSVDMETLSKFISQTDLNETQVFLAAKEKRFLSGLSNQGNISIFNQDEICNQISSFVENISK